MESDDLEWLLSIVSLGSFSAAAKRRGASVSTAARRIDALEARLDVRLLDRRSDGARPTAEGLRIVSLAEAAVAATARVTRAAAAMQQGIESRAVVVSATEIIVSEILAPALPLLFVRHPHASIVLQTQPTVVSLASREADLAVRMARPVGQSLVARKLAMLEMGFFAGARYLRGRDPSLLTLRDERLMIYDDSYGPIPEIDWVPAQDLQQAVVMKTGSTAALVNAAVAGAGIALLPVTFALARRLQRIAIPFTVPSRAVWLVAHRDLRQLPRVANVHRWIRDAFAARETEA